MKPENKPIWYDLYEAFPPRTPPEAMRPVSDEPVRNILYPEDSVRALFYERFGTGTFNLEDESYESECQKFVNEYHMVKKENPDTLEEEIFIITRKRMGNLIRDEKEEKQEKEEYVYKSKSEVKSSIDVSKLW